MRRNKPGRPATGRNEVKAYLLPAEYAQVRDLVRQGRARNLSRAVVEACLTWADLVLAQPGVRPEVPSEARPKACKTVSGWLTTDQHLRWSLAVDRSKLPSGAAAAAAAVLRWVATHQKR